MEIRLGSDDDLEALVAVLGQRRFFPDCLARQRAGGGVLLVAWLDGRPLGDVLRAGEDAVRRLGHDRIALGVGLHNHGGRRLYEHLGYTDWGHGPTVASWQEHDHTGSPVTVTETIDMLVKRL
jgi:GNAT superfamily N-acetyltransferase